MSNLSGIPSLGLEGVCAELESVSQRLREEFQSANDPMARELPDIVRRIEGLQVTFERVRGKSDLLIGQRQAVVLQAVAGLLENARKVKLAASHTEHTDIDAAVTSLTESMKGCSFLNSGERDLIVSGTMTTITERENYSEGNGAGNSGIPLQIDQVDLQSQVVDVSEEDQLYALFEVLPRHVKGHIKFSDVWDIFGKISAAIDELIGDKSLASRASRRSKAVVSRYTVKLNIKDIGKYCGQKASGKSGQAVLLILRSMGVIKMNRDELGLVDRSPPIKRHVSAASNLHHGKVQVSGLR